MLITSIAFSFISAGSYQHITNISISHAQFFKKNEKLEKTCPQWSTSGANALVRAYIVVTTV